MKSKSFVLIPLFIILFGFTSCLKKKDSGGGILSCTGLTADYSTALTNYVNNPSEATCMEFVDAYTDLVNNCAWLTPEQKAEYNKNIKDTDCYIEEEK